MKNRINSFFSSNRTSAVHPIPNVLVKNSLCGKEYNKFCPPNSSDDFCLFFCIYPSSMFQNVYLPIFCRIFQKGFGLIKNKFLRYSSSGLSLYFIYDLYYCFWFLFNRFRYISNPLCKFSH